MKRRTFIKNGGIASAALISTPYLYGSIFNQSINPLDKINVGVIGTGVRGSGLIGIMNTVDNLNVSACCDILPFRLDEGIKATKGKASAYQDYRKLLDQKHIDAVIISSTFNTHSQIAMDAIDAGKHVYCEKTLAKGYEGINSLVKKIKGSNSIFQTGHQYHSSRLYTQVVAMIKEGKVGKITAFECQWNRHNNWRRPVPDPKFERAINWRMYREYSGGLTAELCSHQIDFVNWVLEETPIQVMGSGGIDYWKDGRETYDNVHLMYTYPSGVKAKFTCLTNNAKDGYQIKVLGDKGTIIIDTENAWFYPEGKKPKVYGEVDGVSGATVSWDNDKGIPLNIQHLEPTKQALIDFKDALINNKQPLSNGITGAKTATCVQMGIDAMYENKIVKWSSDIFL